MTQQDMTSDVAVIDSGGAAATVAVTGDLDVESSSTPILRTLEMFGLHLLVAT